MDKRHEQPGEGAWNGEPADPLLDRLLDEALRAEGVEGGLPAGLEERVFEASVGGLRAAGGGMTIRWRRVVVYAAAASVAAAVLVGLVMGVFRGGHAEQADPWSVLSDDLAEAMAPIGATPAVQMAQSGNGFEAGGIDQEMESLQSSLEEALDEYELEMLTPSERSGWRRTVVGVERA